jgi:UDP-glucose 4-epimerase
MVLPRFIAAARSGEPVLVFGDGLQSRCFCYVADTVEGLIRLQDCDTARGGVYNIGGSDEITIAGLARLVIEVLGSKSRIEFVPYDQAYEPGFDDMRRRKPNVEKLARATGFRPATTLRDIILKTAQASPK